MRYYRRKVKGVTFVFSYDNTAPGLLQIYARHLMTPSQAIEAWFNYDEEEWNSKFERFESKWNSAAGWIVIYRYWIEEQKKVLMIASCFREN